MWAFPWLSYFVVAAIVVVIGSMAFVADVRSQLYLGLLSVAVVLGAFWLRQRLGGERAPSQARPQPSQT